MNLWPAPSETRLLVRAGVHQETRMARGTNDRSHPYQLFMLALCVFAKLRAEIAGLRALIEAQAANRPNGQ